MKSDSTLTPRELFALAVLSTFDGEDWNPTQLQKIFFILDQKVAEKIGGPHWNFKPWDYGPYDQAIFEVMRELEDRNLLISRHLSYNLTPRGQRLGEEQLEALPEEARDYIRRLSSWAKPLSFQQLISAVYKEFPESCGKRPFSG